MTLSGELENLYAIFSSYHANERDMDACSCCVKRAQIAALFAQPLRQLSVEPLRSYSFKAMTTWGDENEFKHFLPRLLELTWRDELCVDWIEFKIADLEFSISEREAVLAFFNYVLRELLEARDFWRLGGWLEACGPFGPNEEQFWAKIFTQSPNIFREGLAELLETDWGMMTAGLEEVAESPAARERFEREFAVANEPRMIKELSKILEWLELRNPTPFAQ